MRIEPPPEAFHYTRLFDPQPVTPRGFIEGMPEFQAVLGAADAGDLRQVARRSASAPDKSPWLKGWNEAAIEHLRLTEAPDEVSRLDCVFAFAVAVDAYDALATWAASAADRWVWRCAVPEAALVSLCDLDSYSDTIVRGNIAHPDWWLEAWDVYLERAARYWKPESENFTKELLVRPSLDLVEKVHLRDLIS